MIVDFHTHVFPPFFRDDREGLFPREPGFRLLYGGHESRLAGVGDLIRDMDEGGISRSVIFGFPWEEKDHFQRHNDYIMESVQRYPDRLIGFCCFSLMSPEAAGETERCLEMGLSGVGELAAYGSGLTPEIISGLKDVMILCRRYHVPVLLHVNEPVGHDYPGKAPMTLDQVYRLVKTYPSNRIVLAHWGGGLYFFALMKKEVAESFRNVWFDTAASPYLYKPDCYRIAGDIVGYEKILFGSDYPLLKPQRYFREMTDAGLSSRAVKRITGLNAVALLEATDPQKIQS